MTPIVLAIIGMALSILGLAVKLTRYMTRIEAHIQEMRKDRLPIKRIPHIEYRLYTVEKHLDISAPHFEYNGNNGHDENED